MRVCGRAQNGDICVYRTSKVKYSITGAETCTRTFTNQSSRQRLISVYCCDRDTRFHHMCQRSRKRFVTNQSMGWLRLVGSLKL